ncbi:MAG: hypothetical protein CK425_06485 [Parachlamydia sp.]|nr:MAG: hypothetical protein CK425_06485 [Parachlamydia sp.]
MRTFISICLFLDFFFLGLSAKMPSVNELTLEEKVGQLLMVHFHGEQADPHVRSYILDLHIGGVIYYRGYNGLTSPQQVQSLSAELQTLAGEQRQPIPLLIAIDHEGGVVNHLTKGFTQFPGNGAVGKIGDCALAEQCAYAMGQELKGVGINTNFAPVIDVNNNKQNPIIGIRSFGDDPQAVAALGKAMLAGFRQAAILATLKHFPGHGDVTVDSHESLPVVQKDRQTLDQMELYPFRHLLPCADAVMTAHLLVPALDAKNTVTFSQAAITHLLRDEMAYEGLMITDSLIMQGALDQSNGVVDAAVKSFIAGHDILLLGGRQLIADNKELEVTPAEIQEIHRTLVEMVKTGLLSEVRLNQSVAKILKIKESYQLKCGEEVVKEDLAQTVNTPAHKRLAQKIADASVEIVSSLPHRKLNLGTQKILCIAPAFCSENLFESVINRLTSNSFFYKGLNPTIDDIAAAATAASAADLCVLCTYKSWRNPMQAELAAALLKKGIPTVVLMLGDAWDQTAFAASPLVICTYSPAPCALNAAAALIEKEFHEAL